MDDFLKLDLPWREIRAKRPWHNILDAVPAVGYNYLLYGADNKGVVRHFVDAYIIDEATGAPHWKSRHNMQQFHWMDIPDVMLETYHSHEDVEKSADRCTPEEFSGAKQQSKYRHAIDA